MSLSRDAFRVSEHNGDFGTVFRSAVAAAARASDRRAFDVACSAYAQATAQPNASPNDAFVTAVNDAPPGDILRSVATVVNEKRWVDLGDRIQQASTQTQAFAAPPSQQIRAGSTSSRTTFRRWKWEASSLAPSAVVPQLARRARAPHNLTPITINSNNNVSSASTCEASSPLSRNFHDEAELRSLLMCRPAARPAAAAAAAALRALLPYMTEEDQQSMRVRFASLTPLDALAAVLESARRLCARREPSQLWGAPTVWTDDQLQVPDSLATVWSRAHDEASSQPSKEWPQAQSSFISPSTTATPEWTFHKLQLADVSVPSVPSITPAPPPPQPSSSQF